MRNLVATASRRCRALVGVLVVVAVAARLAVLATAVAIARHAIEPAAALAVGAAALFGLQRVIQGSARVAVQCDLHAATARVLLEGDVLEVPTTDTQRLIFEGNHHAAELLAIILPALAADVIASIAMAPVLATLFAGRVLAVALLLLVVTVVIAMALRRVTRALHTRAVQAYQDVGDAVLLVIDGTIEIVASGAEARVLSALDGTLRTYGTLAVRSSWMSALLGRAPIAAGLLSVGAVIALDESSREALATALVSRALVVAAAIPALLGSVLGAHAATRSAALAAPFAALLRLSPRREIGRLGAEAPQLPAPICGEGLSFAYAASSAPVFRDVSFDWPAGEPLVIVGPNGSGKSTLLRLLVGLRAPTEGVLRVGGRDLEEIDLRSFRRQVAYLPQRPYLGEPYASLRSALRGTSGTMVDDETMRRALGRARLAGAPRERGGDILDVCVGELSVGQRQRVALARLLLQNARMVLLDEPDANLDREGVALVAALVSELSAAGTMVAVAAHTPELAAMSSRAIRLGGPEVESGAT